MFDSFFGFISSYYTDRLPPIWIVLNINNQVVLSGFLLKKVVLSGFG